MAKNVLFIGDVHGLTTWEKLANNAFKHFYEIVFLGDYVDSFHVRPVEQIHNLKNLVNFIRKNKNKVTALIGNHDYAYINNYSGISGYQHAIAHEYQKIFQDNIDLFQIAWGHVNEKTGKYTLATHAGLTNKFWNQYILPETKEGGFVYKFTNGNDIPIHETLNYLKDKDIMWKVGRSRGGSGTPGILWSDYSELLSDRYTGINQFFGHTGQLMPRITKIDDDLIACIDIYGNDEIGNLLVTL